MNGFLAMKVQLKYNWTNIVISFHQYFIVNLQKYQTHFNLTIVGELIFNYMWGVVYNYKGHLLVIKIWMCETNYSNSVYDLVY
jgi:hypothetical protein